MRRSKHSLLDDAIAGALIGASASVTMSLTGVTPSDSGGGNDAVYPQEVFRCGDCKKYCHQPEQAPFRRCPYCAAPASPDVSKEDLAWETED